jgi:hypothetical protein
MYPHSFLWNYLWIAPRVLLVIIVAVMLRNRLFRAFPIFFTYSIFQVLEQGILFILDRDRAISAHQYWFVYWLFSLTSISLRFGILWEVFSHIFKDYPGLKRLNRIVFRYAIVVLLLVATTVAAKTSEDGTFHIYSRIHVVDLGVDVMQSGLWLLLITFSSYFRLSLRSFPSGIAFGLSIFSTVDLATEAMRTWSGFVAGYAFDVVTMATYHCCVLVWLVYLMAPDTLTTKPAELPEHNLAEWNAELQRLLLQ